MKKTKLSVIATLWILLACVLIAGCVTSGPSDPTAKKSWEVSENVRLQLKQDYVKNMSFTNHSCTAEDVNLVVISCVDSGYAVVIGCKCGSIDPDASWDELYDDSAGELLFYLPSGWFIQFCKDGEFRTLNEAFNLRWINYEQLRVIWDDYHTQFPKALETWQQMNGGAMEPPERDASCLDYEVNADGVTCTVTGMGVCNDMDVVIPEYIDGYQVTAIGEMAFWNRIWITSVTMPDSVVSIGRSAFEDCEQLKSITFSASLETIGIYAFKGCKALETVHLPDSLTLIDGGAFSGCSALTEVTIPEHITDISSGVFRNCNKLTILNLPSGITDIGEGAFGGCTSLVVIEFKGTTAQWKAINQMSPWYEGTTECCINCNDGQIVENNG